MKGVLYFLVLNRFKFRKCSNISTRFTIAVASDEFGLILLVALPLRWVGCLVISWLPWLLRFLSFLIAAPLGQVGHKLYQQSGKWLKEHAAEKPINVINELTRVVPRFRFLQADALVLVPTTRSVHAMQSEFRCRGS